MSGAALIEEADPVLWVNSGRDCLGRVYSASEGFIAIADSGVILGTFRTARQAANAIRRFVALG